MYFLQLDLFILSKSKCLSWEFWDICHLKEHIILWHNYYQTPTENKRNSFSNKEVINHCPNYHRHQTESEQEEAWLSCLWQQISFHLKDFSQLSHLKIHLKLKIFKEYLQATCAASIKAILSEHVSRCLASSSGA